MPENTHQEQEHTTMNYWGVNKLKDPNSNHIIRKVLKRREQLSTREQTPKVIRELKDLEKRMEIGKMLLQRFKDSRNMPIQYIDLSKKDNGLKEL